MGVGEHLDGVGWCWGMWWLGWGCVQLHKKCSIARKQWREKKKCPTVVSCNEPFCFWPSSWLDLQRIRRCPCFVLLFCFFFSHMEAVSREFKSRTHEHVLFSILLLSSFLENTSDSMVIGTMSIVLSEWRTTFLCPQGIKWLRLYPQRSSCDYGFIWRRIN